MAGGLRADGRTGVSAPQPGATWAHEAREAALIDRLVEQVLALEPIEHKQHPAGRDTGTGRDADAGGAPDPEGGVDLAAVAVSCPVEFQGAGETHAGAGGAVDGTGAAYGTGGVGADSTPRMLMQMRAVLDREAARLGVDGAEGKAAVDQVALIARTLEKIDQMERQIAADRAGAEARTLSADERAEMRRTVRQLILAAAERLAEERLAAAGGAAADDAPGEDAPAE